MRWGFLRLINAKAGRNVNRSIALCLFLAAGAAQAEPDRTGSEVSFSLGGGLAYEIAGLSLAYRHQRFEGYADSPPS